ncbi:hypothetical protein SS7213T_02778, partial [Staphylococcus simiae CCM 7213 = CCUG 51256]
LNDRQDLQEITEHNPIQKLALFGWLVLLLPPAI